MLHCDLGPVVQAEVEGFHAGVESLPLGRYSNIIRDGGAIIRPIFCAAGWQLNFISSPRVQV